MALLGNYLARTRGMFAWRVYPLSNLSSDPSRSADTHIVQRIDAFFKPVGRAVHHVELVLEWTPSAAADFSFLVFSDGFTSTNDTATCAERRSLRIVGARVHAFRVRVCDGCLKSRAELLLDELGLGSLWTCSWNWNTPLGKPFDDAVCSKHERDAVVVGRWDIPVRGYWEAAGCTAEEIATWTSEVAGYGWMSDDDSEDRSSEWTDESRSCSSSSEGSVAGSDDKLESGDDDCKDDVTDEIEQSSTTPRPCHTTPSSQTCDEDVSGEPEEVVLYPRSQSVPPTDEEELILYHIPQTPLAVYPPNVHPSTHHDPIACLRPIYAPIPTYTPQSLHAEREIIFHSRGVTVAPTGSAGGFIQLTYRLLLEHQQGTPNAARCLIEVTSTLASCAPCETCTHPPPPPTPSDATHNPAQVHATREEEDVEEEQQPRKRTRRAGRKLTARRQRQRVDTGQ
ncbi:hypothetical protein FKP32DRAFT_1759646, partial [Trametes sanguinea]